MSNYELLQELSRQQKIVTSANAEIEKIIKQLNQAGKEDWDWTSVKNASEIMDLSVQSIYRLIDSNRLESKTICGKKFVKKSQIMKIKDYE